MAFILLFYLIGILIFSIFGAVCVFHAFKYKMPGDSVVTGAYVFMAVTAIIIVVSFIFLSSADWNAKPQMLSGSSKIKVNINGKK